MDELDRDSVETQEQIDVEDVRQQLAAREPELKVIIERLEEAKTVRRQTLEREFSI